jgi:hypothetical protein
MYDPRGFATDRRAMQPGNSWHQLIGVMKFDYWHLQRYLRLQGSRDGDELPFEAGSMVMGNVLSMREPVWQTAVATARGLGVDNVFESWGRNRSLMPAVAAKCIAQLRVAIDKIDETGEITPAPDLADDLLPSLEGVRTALHGLLALFAVAVARNVPVETWVD